MSFYIVYRKAREEDDIPLLIIKNGDYTQNNRSIIPDYLGDFFRDCYEEIKFCDIIIHPFLELDESLFNFIQNKLYNMIERCNVDIVFRVVGTNLINHNRVRDVYSFIEKLKNKGVKISQYHIDADNEIITIN